MKARQYRYNAFPTQDNSESYAVFEGSKYCGMIRFQRGRFIKDSKYQQAYWVAEDGSKFSNKNAAYNHQVRSCALSSELGF
jgi:hypothetical protein